MNIMSAPHPAAAEGIPFSSAAILLGVENYDSN